MKPFPSEPNAHWLKRYLEHAIGSGWCTKVFCTTCGAREFRSGLLGAWLTANPGQNQSRIDRAVAISMAESFRDLSDEIEGYEYIEPTRTILVDLASVLGERMLGDVLADSTAGDMLRSMQSHTRELQRRAEEHRKRNDPILAKARREEKKRARAEAHAARLEAKRERDRLWREAHSKSDTPTANPE